MIKKSSTSGASSIRYKAIQMNREMIMETAASMFAEGSYEGTSLDDIARRIGATKGLIYHYFASKSVLLGELLLWIHELFLRNVEPAYRQQCDDPVEKLKAVIRAHVGFNFQYLKMISIVYRAHDAVPVRLRKRLRKLRQAYLTQFIALVEEAQNSGGLVKGSPANLAVAITTLANYLPFYLHDTDKSKPDSVYELIINLFCR